MMRFLKVFLDLRVAAFAGLVAVFAVAILRTQGGDSGAGSGQILPLPPAQATIAPGVLFDRPRDGSTVSNPVTAKMAVGGVLFAAASEQAQPGHGHLLVIVDGPAPSAGVVLKADATHIDLTDASHETVLPNLAPGRHTLTAVFVDSNDTVSNPPIATTITVNVSQ